MRAVKFTSWNDGEFYIGFLNDYPDYMTQGLSKEDLKDNLRSLLDDLESREIPYTKKVEELLVA
jgi:predicted RNase H-like HicB family nuclease